MKAIMALQPRGDTSGVYEIAGHRGIMLCGKVQPRKGLASAFGSFLLYDSSRLSDLSDPERRPPFPAKSGVEEMLAVQYYMQIDARRWDAVFATQLRPQLVIQDRGFHTLLAHAHSNGKLCDFDALSEAEQYLASAQWHR